MQISLWTQCLICGLYPHSESKGYYAAFDKNVSYEAIRKQVNRYKTELEGHIHKVNRTQYLDDKAVAFLDSKRTESLVILLQMDKDEEIQRLSDENKALLVQIAQIQNELIQVQKALSAEKDSVK